VEVWVGMVLRVSIENANNIDNRGLDPHTIPT
jgi:hypothetical protein